MTMSYHLSSMDLRTGRDELFLTVQKVCMVFCWIVFRIGRPYLLDVVFLLRSCSCEVVRWTESIAQNLKRKKKVSEHTRRHIWRSVFEPTLESPFELEGPASIRINEWMRFSDRCLGQNPRSQVANDPSRFWQVSFLTPASVAACLSICKHGTICQKRHV